MSVTPKSGKHGQVGSDNTPTTSDSPSPLAGGHKASFRSTKLARRARSFKEDFLEKISQMRSPPTNSNLGSSSSSSSGSGGIIRPHSPRAALNRYGHTSNNYNINNTITTATSSSSSSSNNYNNNNGSSSNNNNSTNSKEKNPIKELELLVRQVQVALKHFRDVVSKDKLEMLPGNGTIVLETVLTIVSSLRPMFGGEPLYNSASLDSATHHVYQSLARLMKLCDDVLLHGRQSSMLAPDNVAEIVTLLEDAVQELVLVAKDKLNQKQSNAMQVPGAAVVTAVATRLDLPAQRNSLPDIPLTPRERQNLEKKSITGGSSSISSSTNNNNNNNNNNSSSTSGNNSNNCNTNTCTNTNNYNNSNGKIISLNSGSKLGTIGGSIVRSSHSTESVLRAESPIPPPKPPLPVGLLFSAGLSDVVDSTSLGTPPPLPPKKRSQRTHQLIGECCSTSDSSLLLGYSCDRMSFRSRSPDDSNSLLSASAGSLDSMLNHSREEDEIRALMGHSHNIDDGRRENDISDISCLINHNSSGFDDSFQQQLLSTGITTTVAATATTISSSSSLSSSTTILNNSDSLHLTNELNRLSNTDSGFASIQSHRNSIQSFTTSKRSSQQSSSSQHNTQQQQQQQQQQQNSFKQIYSTDSLTTINNISMIQTGTSASSTTTTTSTEFDCSNVIEQISAAHVECSTTTSSLTSTTVTGTIINNTNTSSSSQHSSLSSSQMSDLSCIQSVTNEDGIDTTTTVTNDSLPPAIPQKTRSRRGRPERQPSPYDNVPLENNMTGELIPCLMHQSHSTTVSNLTDTEDAKPPPLPVKKRHMFQSVAYSVMAYMEMFGNCSHQNDNEFLRHSMHMVQAQWHNQQSLDTGLTTTQSCSFVHHTISNNSNNHQHQQQQQQHQYMLTPPVPPPSSSSSSSLLLSTSNNIGYMDNLRLSPGQMSPVRSISPMNSYIQPPALPPKRTRASSTKSNSSPPPPPVSPTILTIDDDTLNINSFSSTTTTIAATVASTITTTINNHNNIEQNNTNNINNSKLSSKMYHTELDLNHHHQQQQQQQQYSPQSMSTPTPLTVNSKLSPGDLSTKSTDNNNSCESIILTNSINIDLMEELEICKYITLKKPEEDGPEIRGGYVDALIVQATKTNKKDFTYQEAFLTTYRTFISPYDLIIKLIRRHQYFICQPDRRSRAREAFVLLLRVVKDLTISDLDDNLVQIVMDFTYQLVCSGNLSQAKVLRVCLIDKYNIKVQLHIKLQNQQQQQTCLSLVAASATLLDFKSEQIAEQMTLLDADLFMKIEIPEVLIWAQEQNEERSPNLTRFTEHFNKMSYWARTKILQSEAKDREKYVMKFIKIMKHLRKINNFNSYLALLSALDSAPIRRLEWQKHITEGLKEYCALIDSSSSFRAYRQALAETSPPCIPYIGLVLQDLTFVHIGNSNLSPDGLINFSKRWQQYNIVENMKRFKKSSYTFKKNERIIAFFRNFDDFIGEDAMWQISESIKPRGGKKTA